MLPRIILHVGMSLDGRLDWFTGDIGRYYELAGRLGADTILSGSNTMLAGLSAEQEATLDPEVSIGDEGFTEPVPGDAPTPYKLMVVVDGRGRLGMLHQFRQTPYWHDSISLCSQATPPPHLAYLKQHGITTIVAGEDRVDLGVALEELYSRHGVRSVRVDSGGILNGVLLRAGLVDEISVVVNPVLVGGTTPGSIFVAPDLTSAGGILDLALIHLEKIEGDAVWLRYDVQT